MRCDKCRERFTDSWIANESFPKYEIKEVTGLSDRTPVNLCDKCSKLFREWLSKEPEDE